MVGLMSGVLEFVLGQVLLGEVTEGRMGVFGCMLVFPRTVRFVVLFAKDAFELVFA